MYHGIAPTLVLNSAVLGHAAHLNWLLVDTFMKFLKEERTFIKLLLPQFFFYVVIIILEKIGLYPVVEKYPWELSDEEKKLPPSNYNSLHFLLFCIEKQKDSFCNLAINRFSYQSCVYMEKSFLFQHQSKNLQKMLSQIGLKHGS
jgi:hypothetical protein